MYLNSNEIIMESKIIDHEDKTLPLAENDQTFTASRRKSIISSQNQGLSARRREFILSHDIRNERAYNLFQKAKFRLKCVFFWTSIIKDLKVYGTGSSLFDGSKNYKEYLPEVMKKKQLRIYGKPTIEIEIVRKYVLLPSSLLIKIWNMILTAALLYTIIVMPWVLAFQETGPGTVWVNFDYLIDSIFVCDIIITANLAYEDKSGNLVYKRSEILKNYIKGMLIIDIISVLPYQYIVNNIPNAKNFAKIFRLGRMTRTLKLLKFDKIILNVSNGRMTIFVAMNRLISGIFVLVILIHFASCIWNFLPQLGYYDPTSWVVRKWNIDDNIWSLYATGCYFATTTIMGVGFGEYSAGNKTEMIFCILLELSGICFYSFTFSTMTSLLTLLDHKETFLNGKIRLAGVLASDTNMPKAVSKNICKQIKKYYKLNTLNDSEKTSIIQRLPSRLLGNITKSMYKGKASNIFFFRNLEKNVSSSILPKLSYLFLAKNQTIFSEGDFPSCIFFIMAGRVAFVFESTNIVFKSMISGSYFGEIGMAAKKNREFGAMTTENSDFLVMSYNLYLEMCDIFPHLKTQIEQTAEQRSASIKRDKTDILDVLEMCEIRKAYKFEDLAGIRFPESEIKPQNLVKYPSDWVVPDQNLEIQNKLYTYELNVIFR